MCAYCNLGRHLGRRDELIPYIQQLDFIAFLHVYHKGKDIAQAPIKTMGFTPCSNQWGPILLADTVLVFQLRLTEYSLTTFRAIKYTSWCGQVSWLWSNGDKQGKNQYSSAWINVLNSPAEVETASILMVIPAATTFNDAECDGSLLP